MSDANGCSIAWCTTDQHEYGGDDHVCHGGNYPGLMGRDRVLLWGQQWADDPADTGKVVRVGLMGSDGRAQEVLLGIDTAEAMFRRGLELVAELRKV
jgi:hypothetical protein